MSEMDEIILDAYGDGDGIGMIWALHEIVFSYRATHPEVAQIRLEIGKRIRDYLYGWEQPPLSRTWEKITKFKSKRIRSLDEAFGLPKRKLAWKHDKPVGITWQWDIIVGAVESAHAEGYPLRQPDETREEEDAFDIAAARLMEMEIDLSPERLMAIYYEAKRRVRPQTKPSQVP